MNLIFGGDDLVAPWVAERTGCHRGFGECRTAAVLTAQGQLAGGLVFHGWQPEAGVMEISGAVQVPFTRAVIKAALGYVFDHCECQMVVAHTDATNTRVRRLGKALGAAEFTIPRLMGRGRDAVLLTLTVDAWRASRFAR